jgi:hypothetical protein
MARATCLTQGFRLSEFSSWVAAQLKAANRSNAGANVINQFVECGHRRTPEINREVH